MTLRLGIRLLTARTSMLRFLKNLAVLTLLFLSSASYAKVKITFWHSMSGQLGLTLNHIVEEFNQSQPDYEVVPVYKGDYNQTLTTLVAAFRAHQQPDIAQVMEIGTATLINPKGIIVPLYQLMNDAHISFPYDDFLAPIKSYYSDSQGRLLAMPFNSSSPILFYNKTAFKKAGFADDFVPKTWEELEWAARKILRAGYPCGFTTGWPSWTQLENFSAWHNQAFASDSNGFSSRHPKILFLNEIIIHHIQKFQEWQRNHIFEYGGRGDDALPLFTTQECAMLIESSSSIADLKNYASFQVGFAPLPYWSSVKGAPQNTIIGGAALWAIAGHSPKIYRGIAQFFYFLAQPKIVLEWQLGTGYLPTTDSAHQLGIRYGIYQSNPGATMVIDSLINKPPTINSKGIRLGNFMRIRERNDEYLEAIWSGNLSAMDGLKAAQQDDEQLIKAFARNTDIH